MSSHSLSDNLRNALKTEDGQDITLRQILKNVGHEGFGLLLITLSLPSALPVPAAGYSTPFGILFIVLGVQMVIGRSEPWLPRKALDLKISESFAEKMIGTAIKFFSKTEKFIHPRMKWINSRGGVSLMSVIVIIMACLMILPIPLTNTFPAMVIFLIGIGLTEKDGLFSLGACVLGIVAVALYAILIYYAYTIGWEVFDHVKDWVKELIGLSPSTD
ncbi:exopolysaccharide biosynthesis protein [Puniceicoccaceae bacterium K14]|nr:exopolysaccharide biosynthesis protein [Puniceicoccaceae bacterium K14]